MFAEDLVKELAHLQAQNDMPSSEIAHLKDGVPTQLGPGPNPGHALVTLESKCIPKPL
ncbi:hypothetical protein DSO57_1014120 [Entomophthora muscae]|uniref:Uncharacterized protein n=1 Tax=Entomophthora muscae TaxID=34485 RepID=A0ACC2RK60_9FUNG|nr:hypothetical protein DSO57_1014120 [Entomophthora muscae]